VLLPRGFDEADGIGGKLCAFGGHLASLQAVAESGGPVSSRLCDSMPLSGGWLTERVHNGAESQSIWLPLAARSTTGCRTRSSSPHAVWS
jgi:hypothetical protein